MSFSFSKKGKVRRSQKQYERVFLSFRGEDTRVSFTSHLYAALKNAGIKVFRDDDSLQRGDPISISLLRGIQQSRISIIVFSKNYAGSRWCLDELVKIMECHRTIGQIVLPVFYDVDPSEVRHQTGEFGKAFQNLSKRILKEQEEAEEEVNSFCEYPELREAAGQIVLPVFYDVDPSDSVAGVIRHQTGEFGKAFQSLLRWRDALREAAGLAGFVVPNFRNESEAIENIVDKVHTLSFVDVSRKTPSLFKHTDKGVKRPRAGPQPQPQPEPEVFLSKYDVFISFRGEDTRASFTSHLYAALQNDGIIVFKDDNSLQRGDQISKSLLEAIENSRIAIIVFSRNYAESRWCLDELVKIMECRRTIGQVVLPVFYDVDPSEVRHQKGKFGEVFQSLLNKKSNNLLNRGYELCWRGVLWEAANLAGFVVLNSRNENEDVKDIVEKVTHLLDKTYLFVADNPVGVTSRVRDAIQLLDIQTSNDNVLILGMWGMGGIGKTTIAKAIYNEIGSNFDGRSFLANVRAVWEQTMGQVYLQEQLLLDIFKGMATKIQSIDSGKAILADRLRHKKVLLVLDDVNELEQLDALCGSYKWFGRGSRIIITTRDMHILRESRVDEVYTMKEMDETESTELFSWHAFKKNRPKKDFAEISGKVVEYCGRLPLALEVLGRYLFGSQVTRWKCVLEKLKRIPNDKVQNKLKISYDGLNDDFQKEVFLDIACFFIGMDRNDVIQILNGCGFFAEDGISVLVDRSLVTVDGRNRLGMHDLLRDMGREIICDRPRKEPEERSRLWFPEDVLDVLSAQTGTNAVEGLALKLPSADTKCFSTKAFEKMKKLRLLQLAGVQLRGDFECLSSKLRWLSWNGFPLRCIPTNFYQRNLVSIVLENSNLNLVWKETQRLVNLKTLNLSHSHYLTQTPDFSNLPNLEKLVLKDCPMVSEVSPSIGNLSEILLIDFEDCVSLRSLPRSIYKLKSLKTLILSGCIMIDELEEDIEQMESLTILLANNTAIKRVPFSVVRSKSIGYISLCGHEGYSRDVFPSIIWSWMSPTNNLRSSFQTSAAMSSLVSFDVPSSSSNELSSFSNQLPRLRSLWVDCNSEDQLSVDSKIILDALYATNSKELELTATTSNESNMTTTLIQLCNHVHVPGSYSLKSLLIQIGMKCQVANILKEMILQNIEVNGISGCFLPNDSYPNWLTYSSEGSSVTFQVPQVEGRKLKTMMCIVYTSTPDNVTSSGLKNVLVKNYTKATIQLYKSEALVSFEDDEGQRVVSSIEPGNKVELVFVFENSFIVKKTTIYLVYDLNVIACSNDENERPVKRFSNEDDPTDDFNQNRKKKNRVE